MNAQTDSFDSFESFDDLRQELSYIESNESSNFNHTFIRQSQLSSVAKNFDSPEKLVDSSYESSFEMTDLVRKPIPKKYENMKSSNVLKPKHIDENSPEKRYQDSCKFLKESSGAFKKLTKKSSPYKENKCAGRQKHESDSKTNASMRTEKQHGKKRTYKDDDDDKKPLSVKKPKASRQLKFD